MTEGKHFTADEWDALVASDPVLQFIARVQKAAVEHPAWDRNYALALYTAFGAEVGDELRRRGVTGYEERLLPPAESGQHTGGVRGMDEYRFAPEDALQSTLSHEIAEAVGEWRRAELANDKARNEWYHEADADKKAELWIRLQLAKAVYEGADAKLKLLADRFNRVAMSAHIQEEE